MNMTIKTGDTVVVIAGKDKGKQGRVLQVFPETGRVTIDGVNMVKKHQKPKNQQDKGGIISKVAPIDASNCMVVCPSCGKASRVAHKEINGKKVRICKKCGTSLDKEFVKQTKKEAKKNVAADAVATVKTTAAKTKTTAKAKPAAKTTSKPAAKTEKPATATTKAKSADTKANAGKVEKAATTKNTAKTAKTASTTKAKSTAKVAPKKSAPKKKEA